MAKFYKAKITLANEDDRWSKTTPQSYTEEELDEETLKKMAEHLLWTEIDFNGYNGYYTFLNQLLKGEYEICGDEENRIKELVIELK